MYFFILLFISLIFSSCLVTKDPFFITKKDEWAQETLTAMTLKEKIGQLFVVAAASDFEQPTEILATSMQKSPYNMYEEYINTLIQEHHIGGVIFLYISEPQKQIALTKRFQSLSKTPLLIALDAEWGLAMRLNKNPSKVVHYPHNITLGALQDERLIYDIGYEIGQQCCALGVHLNLAPVIDVNNNPLNPVIHDRSFGDNPEKVARYGALFAQGLQDSGVIACAKHFPGHGDTSVDSHLELPLISHTKERLQAIELVPFKQVIAQGIGAIMMAHLAIPALDNTPGQPSSMSYPIVTKLLKEEMNFKGLVITDGLGMRAITNHYQPGELELAAFLSGNDILLCPLDVPKACELIEQAIQVGTITQEDLDQRVLKILQAKAWVLEQQKQSKLTQPVEDFIIRSEAYALQKKAYQQAITIVHSYDGDIFNQNLVQNSIIIHLGNLPAQGFLISMKNYTHNVHQYSASFSDEELEKCLTLTQSFDSVIIAVGSIHKYMHQQFGVAKNTRILLAALKKLGKKVHVVVFGSPYCLSFFEQADTLIIAYEDALPAQKAAARVLLGKQQATGILPITLQEW